MNNVILIGGAPTAGKSYLARHLAEELKLPWISTDTIREWMREVVGDKEHYQYLFEHAFENHPNPITFLGTKTVAEIIDHQNKESVEVWKGVTALINTDYVWGSFIIEGIAILPNLVHDFIKEHPNVKVIFLVDNDRERIKEIIYTRGLWDDAKKYPDSVKEKEIEWVIGYNKWIQQEAQIFNLPVIEVGARDSYIEKAKSILM